MTTIGVNATASSLGLPPFLQNENSGRYGGGNDGHLPQENDGILSALLVLIFVHITLVLYACASFIFTACIYCCQHWHRGRTRGGATLEIDRSSRFGRRLRDSRSREEVAFVLIPLLEIEEETTTCCVCMDALASTRLHPCSHNIMCYDCCVQIMRCDSKCPLCRTQVRPVIYWEN